ncbi:hypothetical protein B1A85_08170 [Chroococcidiopsis sp. TS-821]|nr:hypothetical protein B1A85_08170 [Chroococcidiopsis sp. TS-821]
MKQVLYKPYWSQNILDEAISNLVARKISAEKAKNLEQVMKAAFPEAMVEVPAELEEAMRNHPKDRHVLAAAVMANAQVIVTHNLADFQTDALAPWNITAQSPDNFLCELFDAYPDYPAKIVQILQQQSQKYKKRSLSVAELLELLSQQRGANLPNFVNKIHRYTA